MEKSTNMMIGGIENGDSCSECGKYTETVIYRLSWVCRPCVEVLSEVSAAGVEPIDEAVRIQPAPAPWAKVVPVHPSTVVLRAG
jgi:hypothetical protein